MKPRRITQVKRLTKLTGETQQELFDRLVLEEHQRNPEAVLGQISIARARLDEEEAAAREDLGQ